MSINNIYLLLQSTVTATVNDSIPSSFFKRDALIETLKESSFEDLITKLVDITVTFGLRLLMSIIVFYIGKFIISRLYIIATRILQKHNVEASLASFLQSLLRIVLLFILVISIIGILGIETSSFVAIFASAGVAIGLALSGTLQNFAGGVLILLTKPYRVGDFIEHDTLTGTVKEIQIFSTIINTTDNKTVIAPNGGLATGTIINYSSEVYRRITWTFTISYGDDVKVARDTLLSILLEDDRIVKTTCEEDYKNRPQTESVKLSGIIPTIPSGDNSPKVFLGELADNSVNLSVRAWVHTSFYWDVFYSINEKVYEIFPTKGLNFPFPQLDVHLDTAK